MDGIDQLFDMDNKALYMLASAMLVPYLVAVVVRSNWQPMYKKACQVAIVALATTGYLIASDQLDSGNWFRMGLIILVGSQVWYRLNKTVLGEVEGKT